MLTGASRWRDWALFAMVALLPALAMGVLGFWALRNEEAARLREMRLQVEQHAVAQKERFEAELARLFDGAPIDGFADPVLVSPDELRGDTPAADDRQRRCREQADALRRGDDRARAAILAECRDARSAGGRMLWPLVALTPPGAGAGALLAWLQEYGAELAAPERSATREEIARATWWSDAEREQLLGVLGEPGDAARLKGLLSARRVEMLAGRPTIRWSDRHATGLLKRRDDGGYEGFVVHAASLARALKQPGRWPEAVPEGMRLRLSNEAVAPQAVAHRVELLPGVSLVASFDDPEAVAWRSRAALIAVAALAAVVAMVLAALLYARTRRERRLSALRTDFVAAVSHELRTPIASIRMLSELLAEGKAPEDEHDEMHRALAREAKRLGSTVDRLLGFSRMEAGKQRARLSSGVVAEVVTRVTDAFRERHGLEVRTSLDASLRAQLDAEQLAMAIDNLLENARKYAADGTPYEVSVSAEGSEVRIAVRDHGPGVARRDQARIFQPFERADDRLSEATDGSGIGLSLVQHVARIHGGRAGLDSAPGRGATFIIWIPRQEDTT